MTDTMPTPCPTGDGGNSTLTNQDECEIFDKTLAAINMGAAPDSMYVEDDSHVMGVYREADVAGS